MTYAEKLKDPRWQRKRLEILDLARWRCRECGRTDRQFVVHHVFYIPGREPWDYPDYMLLALCDPCHKTRPETELRVFMNVAQLMYDRTVEDIKKQPIWTMFDYSKDEEEVNE